MKMLFIKKHWVRKESIWEKISIQKFGQKNFVWVVWVGSDYYVYPQPELH